MQAKAPNPWSFHNPAQVHFGAGCRSALAPRVQGRRALVVTTRRGRRQFMADPVLSGLDAQLDWVESVTPNPGLAETQAEIDRLASQQFDCVIAFGGGSAMDAAKALAAALAPGLAERDLAALIADPGARLSLPLLPIHAATTTSGTGAEVTPFATIWDHAAKKKLSLASPHLFPQTAIVDPELTYGLPRDATFSTGLDALNQALESVWNRNRSPMTTLMAGRAVGLALSALPRLHASLDDHAARAEIAEASLLAGLCISQTRTAICHSISYPLTAHFGVPHGYACAYTMGAVARLCLRDAPECLRDIAPLTGHANAETLVDALQSVLKLLDLRARLRAQLGDDDAILALRGEMFTPGRSDNFILPATHEMLAHVLADS